jgi:hypothetical protein
MAWAAISVSMWPIGEPLSRRAFASGPKAPAALTFKVSDKGGASVYGLGRFPVTLYYEQWVRLLEHADELNAFPEEKKGKLKLRARE